MGLLPSGEPLGGFLDRLVVGAGLPVERGDLGDDGRRPRLPPPSGPQRPELLPHPPLDPPQPLGIGLGEHHRHTRTLRTGTPPAITGHTRRRPATTRLGRRGVRRTRIPRPRTGGSAAGRSGLRHAGPARNDAITARRSCP
ncbi:hypothetical protein [Streptomyces malaysiensis]|uniref:hypothetical protein n=1 Tax=Streptomyces malaysiensis TaxID=92644 RepID=UPI0032D59188